MGSVCIIDTGSAFNFIIQGVRKDSNSFFGWLDETQIER